MPKPSAAQAIYPHLASGEPAEVEQRRAPNVAQAMYPRPTKDELWWQERRRRDRAALLRHLREAVASVRAEKGR
jgi:hypothetical protein